MSVLPKANVQHTYFIIDVSTSFDVINVTKNQRKRLD